MLEQLLNEIKKGNTTSPVALAERLKTTPEMVQAMLETLEKMGYLREISTDCDDVACGSCPVAGYCSSETKKQPRILVIKKKKA